MRTKLIPITDYPLKLTKCKCNISGIGTLYYLRITWNNLIVYKIGVTSRRPIDRIKELLGDTSRYGVRYPLTRPTKIVHPGTIIQLIASIIFSTYNEAYKAEQALHRAYKSKQYIPEYKLLTSGDTELFKEDVLELDTKVNLNPDNLQQPYTYLDSFIILGNK